MTALDYVVVVELVLLVLIWLDGRAMRQHSAAQVELQRQSLEAQKQYLGIRLKWYETRTKKKENVQANTQEQKGTGGTAPAIDTNS